ncbi:MAG TPA: hypothetical protein PKW76_09205 [bacterium]|nr:hypothetical protein [bacterium]HPG45846.1 hypothetical protein [bacterium]HPM97927.1 hypothetical protein [bacterium]
MKLDRLSPMQFSCGVTFIFAIVVSSALFHHEMWRDELQAWMLAVNSSSLADLFANMQFERHPRLWHVMLFLVSRLTTNAAAMQAVHGLLATINVFIIARFAPFSRRQVVLLVFGYFFAFEYAVISRNYVLDVHFFLLALLCYPNHHQRPLLFAGILFFLAQTTAFGLVLVFCFIGVAGLQWLSNRKEHSFRSGHVVPIALSAVIVVAGVLFSLCQMRSPEVGLATIIDFKFDPFLLTLTAETLWKAFVPIPALTLHFWNSNFIGIGEIRLFLSAVLFFLSMLSLLHKRVAVQFYFLAVIGCLILMYQFQIFMYLRYFGHLFLIYIGASWLAAQSKETTTEASRMHHWTLWSLRIHRPFLNILLLLQFIAAAIALAYDWQNPFSGSEAAAEYIRMHHLDELPMVGDLEEPASAVAARLDKSIYYPRREVWGSYIIFKKPNPKIRTRQVLKIAQQIANSKRSDVLFICNYFPWRGKYDFEWIASFPCSIVADEKYVLYRLRYSKYIPEAEGQ